jgi:hypothetical protein
MKISGFRVNSLSLYSLFIQIDDVSGKIATRSGLGIPEENLRPYGGDLKRTIFSAKSAFFFSSFPLCRVKQFRCL